MRNTRCFLEFDLRSSLEKKGQGYGRECLEMLLGEKDFWETERKEREMNL